MHLTIRPLDTSSDLELAQYRALDVALDDHAYGGHQELSLAQLRAELADSPYWAVHRWVAVVEGMDGGEMLVGRAATHMPLQDNLESITAGVAVHPAHRGRGIGTALLEEALLPALREAGRPLVEAYGEVAPGEDPDDPGHPVHRLAARLGLTRRNLAVCRALPLPLEPALLEGLRAEAEERLGEYRVALWDGDLPEEHLEAYGRLLTQLEIDEPDEEVEHEPAEYTPARLRGRERRLRESGTARIVAVAVAPDGSFVGNSEVHVHENAASTLGYQENTLVMPEHRGHRLGLALKVATHAQLRERAPQLRSLVTWNSHVNPWMIGINEKLGYRIVCHELVLQGRPAL
ncbi:GNAT family N-acetyltransferase [Brachybacterium saurashtrense]|uniref:GNAT family N-acetyltransferase n=1 Tax=Brachybacterium saurashtrense TaxID=556288 RepID=A0A345YJZ8_9MICO|nr:GNAT family N-acetyltransferase [Brachybacterium saurashtrense]AXK44250.1 GNAT family N-acetyltransferase [Brachybacterium saurashtrense]RRR21522.1 GNAT family N-acetyltransferase [Brachybacterium saurashtrense]